MAKLRTLGMYVAAAVWQDEDEEAPGARQSMTAMPSICTLKPISWPPCPYVTCRRTGVGKDGGRGPVIPCRYFVTAIVQSKI